MTEREQNLGWIRLYAEGMNIDNWQDMRLRIIQQLDRLAADVNGEIAGEK